MDRLQQQIDALTKQVATLEKFMRSFMSAAELDPQVQRTIAQSIGANLKLSDLSDVEGTDDATTGEILKKTATTWQPGTDEVT
jgi:hypothetical protein